MDLLYFCHGSVRGGGLEMSDFLITIVPYLWDISKISLLIGGLICIIFGIRSEPCYTYVDWRFVVVGFVIATVSVTWMVV